MYTIGSATLNSSGVATLTRSDLNADPYPLTAVYLRRCGKSRQHIPCAEPGSAATTSAATLTSSPNPSTQGQAVTFTATISSPTVIPTGPVTFTAGKTVLATAQLSGGKAKVAISTLAVGSTKVTATYYGNSNIAKSSAQSLRLCTNSWRERHGRTFSRERSKTPKHGSEVTRWDEKTGSKQILATQPGGSFEARKR